MHLISFIVICSMIVFTVLDLEINADKILGLVVLRSV